MDISTFRTDGLGDATYLLSHAGLGILVDPQRDIDRFMQAAAAAGIELRWVLETHLHNDYVSGGRHASARSGAELVLPAGAVVAFEHRAAFHGEELVADDLAVRPLHTPGHTPEHLSYLVLVAGTPVALFSGGSLLAGSAGRADLLGRDKARGMARAQYQSVRRLAALPDDVGLYPTHGGGSFCTSSAAGQTTSTIGREKRDNPVLAYPDVEAFVAGELDGLLPYPRYYAHMGPVNYQGPEPMPDLDVPELDAAALAELSSEVTVVDARPRHRSAEAHVPGALAVEHSEQFGVWVGWLVPFGAPLALVADADTDVADALTQLARIGFDDVRGVCTQMAAWLDAGHPVASFELVPLAAFTARLDEPGAQVLDVRDPQEHADAALPGALHRYVPDLVDDGPPAGLDAAKPVLVGCATGFRATMAASLLLRAGYTPVVLDDAGIPDVAEALRAP